MHVRISLLDKLSERGETFTVDDAFKVSDLTRESLHVLLSRLEKRGWIERIERGKYMIIPLGGEKGEYTVDEYIVASILAQPYCIGYWSALNYHGFSEQIPTTVFIQTTARKKQRKKKIFGVDYRMIRLKKEKFFGIETFWSGDEQVNITDKEKTLVDCLDKPKYCGGVIEVAKGVRSQDFDEKKIRGYIQKIGNTGVLRRFGYLCDLYGLDLDLPSIDAKNYLKLDPSLSDKGYRNSRWRLKINIDEDELKVLG